MFVLCVTLTPSILNELDKLLPPSAARCKVQHASNNKDP